MQYVLSYYNGNFVKKSDMKLLSMKVQDELKTRSALQNYYLKNSKNPGKLPEKRFDSLGNFIS